MKMPKPTDEDRERFHGLVPDGRGVEVKPMFGNLGAFVNGNMFMGLLGSSVGVKLPDDDLADLRAQPGAGAFGPEDRPMGGYASLPADWSTEQAAEWAQKAHDHVASLPPKAPKPKKVKKA